MGNAARTISQAWEIYAALKSEPRVIFLTEPKDVEAVWNELMSQKGVGPSSWTDAYLAAFAQAHSSTLTTFDAAFVRWTTMKVTILT